MYYLGHHFTTLHNQKENFLLSSSWDKKFDPASTGQNFMLEIKVQYFMYYLGLHL